MRTYAIENQNGIVSRVNCSGMYMLPGDSGIIQFVDEHEEVTVIYKMMPGDFITLEEREETVQ